MEFVKHGYEFLMRPEVGVACLAIIGGFKVLARYTKTTLDDKIFELAEWPFRKVLKK